MAIIEGIRVKNFKTLKDVTLGRMWDTPEAEPLTPMTVVIGKNGVGKSTLFDVFGFLADALKFGVEKACDLSGRGGFEKIRSQGDDGAIELEIAYKEENSTSSFVYRIVIKLDNSRRPFVEKEEFFHLPDKNEPFDYMILGNGLGFLPTHKHQRKSGNISYNEFDPEYALEQIKLISKVRNEAIVRKIHDTEALIPLISEMGMSSVLNDYVLFSLSDQRRLGIALLGGIATLGGLKKHPRISAFCEFVEGWYMSYFAPDVVRFSSFDSKDNPYHLNRSGDNLAQFAEFMERDHRNNFQNILNCIAEKIPGIDSIKPYRDPITNNLYLLFNDKGFAKPFTHQQMSDGTLKVFAYLLLLEDPNPPPFICIEEPENGLYHKLLETLAAEFRNHAIRREGGSQLFITTHQPYFVDALDPDEVWILEKGKDGFSTIRRASDDELVKNMVAEGLPLGGLWYSDYLDAR